MRREDWSDILPREFEHYLVDSRNSHMETYREWKDRIEDVDALVRGDWSMVFPNQVRQVNPPMVQNLAETMVRDVPRLVADTEPTLKAQSEGDSRKMDSNQHLREAIALTHWMAEDGDLLVPLWAIDLVTTGTAFSVAWNDSSSPYPRFTRIDPRFCFPDVINGRLHELMVIQTVLQRQVASLYPDLEIPETKGSEQIEIADIYTKKYKATALVVSGPEGAREDSVRILEVVPTNGLRAQMVALPTHDGSFRGLVDQYRDSMEAKDKIARLMVQYVEQQVASPIVEKGVLNSGVKPGPNTIYHLDPTVADANMTRLQPPGSSPQLFALMQLLDVEQRGGIGYPASRQGQVDQSIASGSFVSSTQGQLTSIVRECMRYISKLRADLHECLLKLDAESGNKRKPLLASGISGATEYSPKKDIKDLTKVKVMYGASAGLDRLQADVRILQLHSAGIITAETARSNLEFVDDPEMEADGWEKEQSRKAVLQRFLTDPNTPFDLVLETLLEQENGKSFPQALEIARRKMQEKAQAEAEMQAQQQGPLPQGAPAPAMEEEAALAGQPVPESQPGQPVEFNPPPASFMYVGGK